MRRAKEHMGKCEHADNQRSKGVSREKRESDRGGGASRATSAVWRDPA